MKELVSTSLSPHMTALRSLFLVAMHHGVRVPPELLANTDPGDPITSVMGVMREIGLTSRLLKNRSWRAVTKLGSAYPAMVERTNGGWMIVASPVPGPDGRMSVAVLDPAFEQAGIIVMSRSEFEAVWTGRMLLSKRRQSISDENQPFGLLWFLPEIIRNGRYLRDIAIAAIMSTLISFSTPMLFNVMIDKVVPHHSYNTLWTLILVFCVTIAFDSMFNYVRQYLAILASNKIDARLAVRTFAHLLSLPLHFFESNPAGVLLRDMHQAETVRQFLTGRLFQTMLDALTLPLLLVGLCLYSAKLTMIVAGFALAITAIMAVTVPVFRRGLERLYQAEGERQADMVETLQGMRAIKSLALEEQRKTAWDVKVAASVLRRESVGRISTIANVITSALERLMQVCIVGFGIQQVFAGDLSIGALVAFNMLSGRVTGPLVQMVGLINEYQQTALSVKMLGRVMNQAPERDPSQRGIRPRISGRLEFSEVRFSYEGSASPALSNISFAVEEGQMIGVVGRSGSGKTTLTRLIQGIHTTQEGAIRLDGTDLRHIDLGYLRRNIGVVLQENILFRGTIFDNIAAARPDSTLDEVMEAARLAGADEFIDRLPQSYETRVGENATNFSGGQRQRIAIARALLTQPRLLLFDEATSALDPDSEAIVQQNLAAIAQGRTMIVVSHRLSTLVRADAILVLERGVIADYAPHAVLVERCPTYRRLWDQQTRHMQ